MGEDADDRDDDNWETDRDDYDVPSLFDEPCCLGKDCLNPHPYHFAFECFDLEMAEASMSYAEHEGEQ